MKKGKSVITMFFCSQIILIESFVLVSEEHEGQITNKENHIWLILMEMDD